MNNKKQDPIESAVTALFRGIALMFRTIYHGVRRLNNRKFAVVFAALIIVSVTAWMMRPLIFALHAPVYIRGILLCTQLAAPVIYLLILGGGRLRDADEYYKIFADINFRGKDKKYPFLLYARQDGKKKILAFKSNISLETWRKSIAELETALDCRILKIESPDSRKKAVLTTVDSSYRLPTQLNWKDEYISPAESEIIIGENELEPVMFDLNRTPHMLAAGETGSGKSVILRLILWQLAKRGAVIFMLDFKGGVEFGLEYEEYGAVVTDRENALTLLELLVKENELRLNLFREKRVKNLREYNNITGEKLSRIGVFCDEIAEMLDKKGADKENKVLMEGLEGALSTLARLSRATGINLFLGVQRPDANVLTGQIKNNVPVRACGRFADKAASEIVLGNTKAVDLPDVKGRFLYKVGADTVEFQAYYFDDEKMLGDVDRREQRVMLPQLERRMGKAGQPSREKVRQAAADMSAGSKKQKNKHPKTIEAKDDIPLNLNFGGEA